MEPKPANFAKCRAPKKKQNIGNDAVQPISKPLENPKQEEQMVNVDDIQVKMKSKSNKQENPQQSESESEVVQNISITKNDIEYANKAIKKEIEAQKEHVKELQEEVAWLVSDGYRKDALIQFYMQAK